MPIARAEVAHLARLSRLALSDEELDHFAGQLDQIISAVARVQEVAADGIPPMSHAVPVTNVFRDDVVVPRSARTRSLDQAPAWKSSGSASRGSWRRTDRGRDTRPGEAMPAPDAELTRMTAAELAAAIAAGEVSALEVTDAHLDRIAAVDGGARVPGCRGGRRPRRRPRGGRAPGGRGAARPAGRRAARAQGRVHHQDMPTTCGSRILEAGGRRTTRP